MKLLSQWKKLKLSERTVKDTESTKPSMSPGGQIVNEKGVEVGLKVIREGAEATGTEVLVKKGGGDQAGDIGNHHQGNRTCIREIETRSQTKRKDKVVVNQNMHLDQERIFAMI